MGEIEFGKCDICGKDAELQRTYFNYDIKCECHSPNHFEIVCHCKDCIPKEPREIKVIFSTEKLNGEKIEIDIDKLERLKEIAKYGLGNSNNWEPCIEYRTDDWGNDTTIVHEMGQ